MIISVNDMLAAGIATSCKLPDIYWEFDLTGSEMKVLRYVFNHCIRLYKFVKVFPRGEDGSPRFWRGKEKMAEDCSLSTSGFRSTVRHLSEMGFVTSMDGEANDDCIHCIGLSTEFLDKLLSQNQNVNNLRSHNLKRLKSLKDIIVLLYDKITVYKEEKEEKEEKNLSTNVLKLVRTRDKDDSIEQNKDDSTDTDTDTEQNHNSSISKNNTIVRTPIRASRTKLTSYSFSNMLAQAKNKLKSLQNVKTAYDREVIKIADYYDYKCRSVLYSTGFRCLSKDFRNHKNWKFLERIYELCKSKGWDYRIYIDSQFDRCKYWNRKQKYPYLNQFNSENAIKYYTKYVKDYEESSSVTKSVKIKPQKIKAVNDKIIGEVVKDCESISNYILKAKTRKVNEGLSDQQIKMIYISDHWLNLSASYLSTIPWFIRYLSYMPEEKLITELKSEIESIQSSKKMTELTSNIVTSIEEKMSIPKTLCVV